MCLVLIMSACILLPTGSVDDGGGDDSVTGGDDGTPTYAVEINPDKNAALELTVSVSGDAHERKIIEELGKGFQKEYPNITFKIDPISGNIYDTVMGYYRANRMPDLLMANSFSMLTLGAAKVVAGLDPYIEAETQNGTFDADDYYADFWKLGQRNFDGTQWMVPRAADQVVVHYNKSILRAAGVDLDPATTKVKNGWTWRDFLDVCARVRSYYDGHGMGNLYLIDSYLNWEANFNAILRSCGAEYWGEGDAGAIVSENTKTALNLMKDLVEKKYTAKFSGASQANFDGGQGAFLFHSRASSLTWNILKEVTAVKNELGGGAAPEDIYDVATFPLIGDSPKIGAGAAGYCVAATIDASRRDYAWQFLKFMLSRDGQNIIAECGANYPPIRKDMADPTAEGVSWGLNLGFNLDAYTWAARQGYACATDFILKRPAMAQDLIDAVNTMIKNYVDYTPAQGSADANAKLDREMQYCRESLEYWAFDA
jgi:ABC-type glycerol-3-phosphate transport system substrate-binding protein